jgi:hypothetical protein
MRKLLFAILITLCLSVNVFGAKTLVQRPQTDSIVNSTDTTGWELVPEGVDSVIILAQGIGGATNDSTIISLDLCEYDTTDAQQVWAKEVQALIDADATTVNGTGTYGREIAGFKYYRMIRYSNTATVTGAGWLLWIY